MGVNCYHGVLANIMDAFDAVFPATRGFDRSCELGGSCFQAVGEDHDWVGWACLTEDLMEIAGSRIRTMETWVQE